ncbi:MAG: hypothetical protein ACXVYM_01935 [Gaiellaceae bacterium]
MPDIYSCTYELRRNDDSVSSTGRITLEERPQPGETLALGHEKVRVEEVLPAMSGAELHLVLSPL